MKATVNLITGKSVYVSLGTLAGYCHCAKHYGYLTNELAEEHSCNAKECTWFEKFNTYPFWIGESNPERAKHHAEIHRVKKAMFDQSVQKEMKQAAALIAGRHNLPIVITHILPRVSAVAVSEYIINFVSDEAFNLWDASKAMNAEMSQLFGGRFFLRQLRKKDGTAFPLEEWLRAKETARLNWILNTPMKPLILNINQTRDLLHGATMLSIVVNGAPQGALLPMPFHSRYSGCYRCVGTNKVYRPPFNRGDVVYVAEPWRTALATVNYWEDGSATVDEEIPGYQYKADGAYCWQDDFVPVDNEFYSTEITEATNWNAGNTMVKKAARQFYRVVQMWPKKLQTKIETNRISDDYTRYLRRMPPSLKQELWDKNFKPEDLPLYGWDANPWVWLYKFERVTPKEN